MGRSLLSAVIAAALFAAHVVVLTLYLNPEAALFPDGLALLQALFLPYLLAATLLLGGLAIAARPLLRAPGTRRRPIEKLPWFATLTWLVCTASALLFWMNLLAYRHSVPAENVRALAASSLALLGCALVLVAVGVDAMLFPSRGRGVSAALVVLSAAASVVIPLASRPLPASADIPVAVRADAVRPVRRIVLVGVDGLGLDSLRKGVADGTLPSFAYLLRQGAHGPLATLHPSEGPPVWTTILTGVLPRSHGVKSFVTYRLRGSDTTFELLPKGLLVALLERAHLVRTAPVLSGARRRPAVWNTLNAFALDTGLVRLWATHPVERVRGFMLSPRFHLSSPADPTRDLLHPPDLIAEVRAQMVAPGDIDEALVSEFIDPTARAGPEAGALRDELVVHALAPDLTYRRAGAVLRAAYDPPFFATYINGLDVVGHTFLPYAQPGVFGNVAPEAARRYGRVVARYTTFVGEWVVDLVEHRRPSDVVVLVSGFGMEPATLWDRLVALLTGRGAVGGVHQRAPDGYFIAVGDGIRPGATLSAASVADVAPTLLYLMGLPVARDLDGRVLTEILDEDFARAHPLTFVPSYRWLQAAPPEGPPRERPTEDAIEGPPASPPARPLSRKTPLG